MNNTPGQRIRISREARGWTQAVLAEKLGIKIGTLSGYERNYRQPNLEMIKNIATVLDVSADYILGLKSKSQAHHPCANNLHTKTVYNITPQSKQSSLAHEIPEPIPQRQDLQELAHLLIDHFSHLEPEIVEKFIELIRLIKRNKTK
ncbi:MAG: helix-turn-helix domain-containing protein [bacterium]|jgi:transcriptional regulator with XRE-family HTH domain